MYWKPIFHKRARLFNKRLFSLIQLTRFFNGTRGWLFLIDCWCSIEKIVLNRRIYMLNKTKDSKYHNFNNYYKKLFPFIFIPTLLIFLLSDSFITNNPFEELEDYGSFFFVIFFSLLMATIVSSVLISLIWTFTKKVH